MLRSTAWEQALARGAMFARLETASSAKRRENVSGAFGTKNRKALDGLSVLLIDDVMTTGATAASCARALKRAGARQVTLLTLARVDRRLMFDPLLQDSNFSGRSEDAQSRSFA